MAPRRIRFRCCFQGLLGLVFGVMAFCLLLSTGARGDDGHDDSDHDDLDYVCDKINHALHTVSLSPDVKLPSKADMCPVCVLLIFTWVDAVRDDTAAIL